MKNKLSIILLAYTIILLNLIYKYKINLQPLSDVQKAPEEFENNLTGLKPSKTGLITELFFDETPLFYDAETNSWFFSYTASDNRNPLIKYSSNDSEVKIIFPKDIQFIPGNNYSFITYNNEYYMYNNLIITSLPLISIQCETMDIPNINTPMEFTLFENDTRRIIKSAGVIHIRGNSSVSYPKKNFRISLSNDRELGKTEDFSLLGMRQDDDWILYAAYNDPEKIRNVFSSNLWFDSCGKRNAFGFTNGMEYRWTELFINDHYWGLYAIGFPIDAKQQQIHKTQHGRFNEFLYKQKWWGPIYEDGKMTDYLILQFPGNDMDDPIGEHLRELYFAQIKSAETVDLFVNDVQNAIDTWLFLKLIQAVDHVTNYGQTANMIYTIKTNENGNRFLYTPWDMDRTWGMQVDFKTWDDTLALADPDENKYDMTVNPVSVLIRNGDPEVIKLVKDEYSSLRENEWSEQAINSLLDDFERDIFTSGAFLRDSEKWPNSKHSDPNRALNNFREYVHQRFHSMDVFITDL